MPNAWPPYLSLVVSALGGAVGALLIRSMLKSIGKFWASCVPLATHYCGLEDREHPGVVCHGWGRSVEDSDAQGKRAWEHTSAQVTINKREHTIFGPYINDFGKPGYYKIEFRISGSGLPKSEDPVLVLDVIQAPFAFQRDYYLLGQRIVRARDLTSRYRSFSILCYAVGTGVYEYRCSVIRHSFDKWQPAIRFDTIRVYRHIPLWEAL